MASDVRDVAQSKHTPGPWWIEDKTGEDDFGELLIIGPRKGATRNGYGPAWEMCAIRNTSFWDNPKTEAEDRANAALIAAAPDLLEACEAMANLFADMIPTVDSPLWKCRVAIDKARSAPLPQGAQP